MGGKIYDILRVLTGWRYFYWLLCLGVCVGALVVTCGGCNTSKFIKTDIEKKDGIEGVLGACWRVQKDNAASGGGNARNCDTLQDEYIRQEKMNVCKTALNDAGKCFKKFYGGADE